MALCGSPDREPLSEPGDVPYDLAASFAAYGVLLALRQRGPRRPGPACRGLLPGGAGGPTARGRQLQLQLHLPGAGGQPHTPGGRNALRHLSRQRRLLPPGGHLHAPLEELRRVDGEPRRAGGPPLGQPAHPHRQPGAHRVPGHGLHPAGAQGPAVQPGAGPPHHRGPGEPARRVHPRRPLPGAGDAGGPAAPRGGGPQAGAAPLQAQRDPGPARHGGAGAGEAHRRGRAHLGPPAVDRRPGGARRRVPAPGRRPCAGLHPGHRRPLPGPSPGRERRRGDQGGVPVPPAAGTGQPQPGPPGGAAAARDVQRDEP